MDVLRTPEDRFVGLPGYGFEPHYTEIDGLRIHYLDVGPRDGAPVLLLHGEPSWSYLYRKMLPTLVEGGSRVIAPDLVGFGRSDKPIRREDYTYERHVGWMTGVLDALELRDITLFCQDWGGLIGLRLAAENEQRFARIIAANTSLPTGDQPMGRSFLAWQRASQRMSPFAAGQIVQGATTTQLAPEVVAAYDAPFPDERYLAGAREFPMLVPTTPDNPASEANRRAWQILGRWQKPFLCTFSDGDPITRGADQLLIAAIPGAQGQPHTTITGAGHFLQEDKGEEIAAVIVDFIQRTRS